MSLLKKWEMDVKLKSDLILSPSWFKANPHLGSQVETTNSLLSKSNDLLESNLQNHFLDFEPKTCFSFPIDEIPFDKMHLSEFSFVEAEIEKPLIKHKRKIKIESRKQPIPRINKRRKKFFNQVLKRKQKLSRTRGGGIYEQKRSRKLLTFPHYADLPIDDAGSSDQSQTMEDLIARRYQFTPSKESVDSILMTRRKKRLKEFLIQFIASSLVSCPAFKRKHCDKTKKLEEICSQIAGIDPEFLLKVALYGRQELNIRSASNYLVAFAAMNENCKKFVRKYYSAIVVLPSDWIEIAEFCIYQSSYEMQLGALPVCLRRAMIEKFPDFDLYQLGKYNKTNSKITHNQLEDGFYPNKESRIEEKKESGEKLFTLKQLIRQLHISKPAHNAMCLLGKKYPGDLQSFYKSGLDGTFDDKLAGQRMKLPVPETWETQISLHGNKAKVWQSLIDKKKLPYMATLRNIRNLIKAKISQKHEKIILNRISDEKSVIKSRQLPTQFFSAYATLDKMEKDLEGGGPTAVTTGRKRKLDPTPPEINYNKTTLNAYRRALDDAVKIATTHNLEPIRGKTIMVCCLDMKSSHHVSGAAKSFGRSWTLEEVAILLGLMCHYSCEHCELVIWNEEFGHFIVKVQSGNILENVQNLLKTIKEKVTESEGKAVQMNEKKFLEYLYHKLESREKIDTLIQIEDCEVEIKIFKNLYRLHVNPNLLFVNISLMANSKIILPENADSQNRDISIKGFSVQLLNFIANYQNENQLTHVEKIDVAYDLKPTASVPLAKSENDLKDVENSFNMSHSLFPSKMKTLRVFISSTFNDMHGERDLLTRFIFPKLRKWAEKHGTNIYEVDLRWGIPEEEAKSSRNLELCLSEVSQCDLFIGILGERYGWVPSDKDIPPSSKFDWVRAYPNKNASITELEMHLGALSNPKKAKDTAFFFFRNMDFETNVPKKYLQYFMSENSETLEQMENLKQRIRNSGLEVFDGYPAEWGGITEGKAFVSGLDEFGKRVFHQIKNAVEKSFDSNQMDTMTDDVLDRYVKIEAENFVGHKLLIDQCLKRISSLSSGVITVTGWAGSGKSALMAKLIHECRNSKVLKSSNILVNIIGTMPDSTNIMSILTRFCWQMQDSCSLNKPVPKDYMSVINKFQELLVECTEKNGQKIIIFIDGLDNLEDSYQPYNFAWISKIPQNVVFVLSAQLGELYHRLLHSKKHINDFTVGELVSTERAKMVRKCLSVHRKTLEESIFNNQMRLLTFKMEASCPFFLKLACEELRLFGVFEKVTDKLKSLPGTVPALLQEVFLRLEQEVGKDAIQVALGLLFSAKNGLLSMELFELLNLHWKLENSVENPLHNIHTIPLKEIASRPPENCLSRSKFVRLHYVLHNFLNFGNTSNRSNLLIINHKLTKESVQRRYLTTDNINYYHRLLSAFFYQKSDCYFDGLWSGEDPRSLSALPYHLVCSGSFSILVSDLLCNLHYIYTMCKFGLTSVLLEYFFPKFTADNKMEMKYQKLLMGEKASQFKQFVTSNRHILDKCPSLLWQQVLNCPMDLIHLNLPFEQNCLKMIKLQNRPKFQGCQSLIINNFPQPLTCVSLSDEGSLLACGSEDCVVYLLNSLTGKELQRLIGHSDAISDVCFVTETFLCSASWDTTLSLWNTKNGHRVSIMKGHKRKVTSCCVNADKTLLASASLDKTTRIWNPHEGEQICCFSLKWPINCIAFSPEENRVLIGCWDSTLQIWDFITRSRIAVIRGHESSVQAVTFSPSGKHIMSSSMEGEVKIWTANKGILVGNISAQSGPINKIAFNPQGNMMATVGDDCKTKIWTSQFGTLLHSLQNNNAVPAICVCLSPDISTVAVGYHDGKIVQFDLSTGVEILSTKMHSESVTCLKFTLDEGYLISGCTDSSVLIFCPEDGELVCTLAAHSDSVTCLDVCSKYLVTSSMDMTTTISQLDDSLGIKPSSTVVLRWHDAPVTCCALNYDETFLATAGRDKNVVIWDLAVVAVNKEKTNPYRIITDCHKDWITDCKWSNSALNFVTASNDFNLKVWKLSDKKPICELIGHTAPINSVSYMNGVIVSCSSDGCTKVWSDQGFEVTSLYGHPKRVNCCDIKVSGENLHRQNACDLKSGKIDDKSLEVIPAKQKKIVLATCGDSGLVQVWEPTKALELACFTGHMDRVVGLSFKKDLLATCSADGSLRLWSIPEKNLKPLMTNMGDTVTGGDYDPKSNLAIFSCRNGTIQIWDCKDISKPVQLITPKVSDYSINCVCFFNGKDKKFATGSDDKSVTVWNLIPKGNTFLISKKNEYFCKSPVLSLKHICSFKTIKASECHMFVSASICGKIFVHGMASTLYVAVQYDSLEPIIGFDSFYNGTNLEIVSLHSPLSLQNWIMKPNQDASQPVIEFEEDVFPSLLTSEITDNHKLTSAFRTEGLNYIGLSNGDLFIEDINKKTTKSFKLHPNSSLDQILVLSDVVLTAAADGIIKVWTLKFHQIGEFHCSSAVTCLINLKRSKDEINFMAGDALGYVYCLSMNL